VLDELNARALSCSTRWGSPSFHADRRRDLPYGRKRALEIATTLAMDPEMMLLDEPTAGMGHEDVHRVTQLIRKVAQGRTVLMVEHNMSVVPESPDRITVLAARRDPRRGRRTPRLRRIPRSRKRTWAPAMAEKRRGD
jgi:branched-chain amino acid transport system ATP-binding protein